MRRSCGKTGILILAVADATIEAALGEALSPDNTHVFVSGHPEMVEDIQRILIERGYTLHSTRSPGTLHVERYW